jgi:hypothetical protein
MMPGHLKRRRLLAAVPTLLVGGHALAASRSTPQAIWPVETMLQFSNAPPVWRPANH